MARTKLPLWRHATQAGLASALALAAGLAIATGPGAAWIVDHVADGVNVWRLGRLQVDGVSGANIGDLRAAHLSLRDADGIWAEADNVRLGWRPIALFTNQVRLDAAQIGSLHILRQPALSPPRPSGGGGGFDVRIDALHVERIALDQPVYGAAAEARGDLALDLKGDSVQRMRLQLTRLDSQNDRADINLQNGHTFALHIDVHSAPGGVIARALGIGEHGVTLEADGQGGEQGGQAHWRGTVGAQPLSQGALSWTATHWNIDASASLNALPSMRGLRKRLGDQLLLGGGGVRGGHFTAFARTPNLNVNLEGDADQGLDLKGAARLDAETADLSDIAPEAPVALGPAHFSGVFSRRDGRMTLSGQLEARRVEALGESVRLAGDVRVGFTPDRFDLTGDLHAPAAQMGLFEHARLQTQMDVDRRTGRYSLRRARLSSEGVDITAQGWSHDDDGQYAGEWRARRLQDFLLSGLRGQFGGRWRAQPEPETHIWTASADGDGQGLSGAPDILPQALGATPSFDASFRFENHGLTVSHARLEGPKLRAGAMGRIVHGQADLRVEMSARGPLNIGAARFDGAIDGVGHLRGRIVRPTLEVNAQLANFTAAGIAITQPDVTFTLAPGQDGHYRGRASVEGRYAGQVAAAASELVIIRGGFDLPSLDARLGALQGRGTARVAEDGFSADLVLSGAIDNLAPGLSGGATGHVRIAPSTLSLNANLTHARMGLLRIAAAHVEASGPFNAIQARYTLRGALRQAPLDFAGDALIDTSDGVRARIEGQGALAGVNVATKEPIFARWGERDLVARLNVQLGDGGVLLTWSEQGRALSGEARVDNAPMAPLAAIWGETATGAIAGHAAMQSGGAGLSGDADLTFNQARFAGRQRGALDAHLTANLTPSRLQARLDATSSDGLVAAIEADAPVETSAAPIRIALQPQQRGSATWSIHGPADTLWSAARLQDQSLSGALEGRGQLQFGAGYLAGDGGLELTHGRFEDKLTGVKLQNINTRIAFNNQGVTLERFSADDSRGGSLTATGGSANPHEGRIALTMRDLRLVDRPDARARASGDLALEWQGLHSTLSGDLNILEGDMRIAAAPNAGIPVMDVIEINRPGEDYDVEAPAPRGAGSTDLNVRIHAANHVFTRGRGVDAEWSLDMRLQGTAAQPRFYGQAQAIRGTLSLSGQPFEIQTGTINFNGAPEDAQINLVAERTTTNLTARIALTGTASDPDIQLSSTPALPEDEILPQVLFGQSIQDLSGLQAAQVAASLASLSGRSSLDLLDAARSVTGLDRFNVRQDDHGGFLVGGGVYLTRDVYVEVARDGLGQAQTQVEWTVRPKLVLITSFLPNGDRKASLRWRRESD